MLRDGILLTHGNLRPHIVCDTQQCLTELQLENFENSPYNPDLTSSEFQLFKNLKSFLAGKNFKDDDEVRFVVYQWLKSQAASFFEKCIQALVPCYDKSLNNVGTDVEN